MTRFLILFVINVFQYFRASLWLGLKSSWLSGVFIFFLGQCSLDAHGNTSPQADPYPKKINFRNIMQNEDIALGEVEAIIQDYQGFMWLGGRNALLRYDGYEFLSISAADNPGNLNKLSSVNQVMELLEDSRRELWVASRSGLYRYDRNYELLFPLQTAQGSLLLREIINALAESPTGELLVGSRNGLYILNINTLELSVINHKQDDPQGLPSNIVNDLLVDDQGMVWVGLDDGLLRINWKDKSKTLFVPDPDNPESVANNSIKTIARDHHGNIWAGADNGVYRLDPHTGRIKTYRNNPADPQSLGNNISRQIYVDKQGWVWIGSDQGGVNIYDEVNDRFLRFTHQDGRTGSLSSNTVRRIYEDAANDIWVGTYPSGVNIYDRSTAAISVYKKEADPDYGLLDNNVEAVEEDKEGNLWIGAGGITRYDPRNETFTHYRYTGDSNSRAASASVLNGVVDSDGEIRFGSWANGIQKYNPDKDRFEKIPVDPNLTRRGEKTGTQLNDNMVWSIYEDKRKNLWIATHYNGLTRFDKKSGIYTYYPCVESDPTTISSSVTWISFEDSQERFWVGTAYGLNLMDRDQGTFKRYLPNPDNPRSLADSSVLAIHEDNKGRLWFGTDAGLHLYHPETDDFSVYGIRDGFVNQGIRAIIEDHQGNLWLGTNNGIVMYNPDTGLVKNYTRYNGELIGGVATGSAVATAEGRMVFGTRNGLYIFNVDKLLTNEKAPSVVFTDFRIFTQKVPIGGPENILTKSINETESITLDYTKTMLSFSFAALNYRDPEKNQYAYKLEGFDDQWREVASQRTALYTNLPAGLYQFRIKASNNDGVWSGQEHSIALRILPPPWKTWWAYSLYFLISVGALLYFVYSQHRKILDERKTSRELELKVAERTSELQNKNEELKQAYAQLEKISLSDPLTGLNNRRYLQKIMPMDIAKVQRSYGKGVACAERQKPSTDLTFFILDIDYFKSVNDIYGHAAGDQLLTKISELLLTISRESDCVIRWGGEEFLLVSRFADRDEAPLMAERIRKNIEQSDFILPDGKSLKKTCSIGYACFPFLCEQPTHLSWEQVIDIADHALYAAKKSGRNRTVGLAANPNADPKTLYLGISSNLKALIEGDELRVIATHTEDLVWD